MSGQSFAPIRDPHAAQRRRRMVVFIVLLGVLLLAGLLRLCIGSDSFGLPQQQAAKVLELRLERLVMAALAGTALAVAGVALQALLRNPLAEPFILGLSTGAAAGIMIEGVLLTGMGVALAFNHGGAIIGASLCMAIVFLAGRKHGVIDPLGLLLAGVVISTINGAIILMCSYFIGPGGLRDDLIRWMMGYLQQGISGMVILITGVITICGLLFMLRFARAMDIGTFSDSEAHSMGVHLPALRLMLFFTASVLTAGAVVLAGPIAFVGLISPHLGRVLLGPRHGALLVASAMIGATLLILADVLAAGVHLLWGMGVMPMGIFIALLGGPMFLWMLRPHLGRS